MRFPRALYCILKLMWVDERVVKCFESCRSEVVFRFFNGHERLGYFFIDGGNVFVPG